MSRELKNKATYKHLTQSFTSIWNWRQIHQTNATNLRILLSILFSLYYPTFSLFYRGPSWKRKSLCRIRIELNSIVLYLKQFVIDHCEECNLVPKFACNMKIAYHRDNPQHWTKYNTLKSVTAGAQSTLGGFSVVISDLRLIYYNFNLEKNNNISIDLNTLLRSCDLFLFHKSRI